MHGCASASGVLDPRASGFARLLLLQVHYQIVRPEGDRTGVRLKLTRVPQSMSAGMLTYAVGFVVSCVPSHSAMQAALAWICMACLQQAFSQVRLGVVWLQVPPHKSSHLVPNSCCYSGFQPLTGFAFRVHAHALGRCAEGPKTTLQVVLPQVHKDPFAVL